MDDSLDSTWTRTIDADVAREATAILREVIKGIDLLDEHILISAYSHDAPELLPVGTEGHWRDRRLRVVRMLEKRGVLTVSSEFAHELHVVVEEPRVRRVLPDLAPRTQTPGVAQLPRNQLDALPAPIEDNSSAGSTSGRMHRIPGAVFIIHGHDEPNTLRLENLLRRHGIDTRVLRYIPGKGRTLIEKFEDEAQPCGFAVVLLTSDDVVLSTDGRYTQARPNAVFELGWFCGRLGRARTLILLRRDTRLHSDLDGIDRAHFTESVEECIERLQTELVNAGYTWH